MVSTAFKFSTNAKASAAPVCAVSTCQALNLKLLHNTHDCDIMLCSLVQGYKPLKKKTVNTPGRLHLINTKRSIGKTANPLVKLVLTAILFTIAHYVTTILLFHV